MALQKEFGLTKKKYKDLKMKRLLIIFLALIIPVLIWYVERMIAKRRGEIYKGPSLRVLIGFVVSIMLIIVSLLINQTSNAPPGSKYIPANSVNGSVVPGSFE